MLRNVNLRQRASFLLFFFSVVSLAVLSNDAQAQRWPQRSGVQLERDITYKNGASYENKAYRLDLTYKQGELRPLVVFVHGGGWRNGDKKHGRVLERTVSAAGYAFASINYRLWPSGSIEESASDIATAMAFLIDKKDRYWLDTQKIAVIAHSAGAHLAALAVLNPTYFKREGINPQNLRAVLLLDGVAYDAPMHVRSYPNAKRMFGSSISRKNTLSPIQYVRKMTTKAAFYIAYGNDRRLTQPQAISLARALQKTGTNVIARDYTGKPHGAFIRDWRDARNTLPAEALSFLNRQLGAP